jgi:hypothetical protein
MDAEGFGFHGSAGLMRIVAAARRVRAEGAHAACLVHGLSLGGGQSLSVIRHGAG